MPFLDLMIHKVVVVPLLSDNTQNVALLCYHLCMNAVCYQGLTLVGLQSSFVPQCVKSMSAKVWQWGH